MKREFILIKVIIFMVIFAATFDKIYDCLNHYYFNFAEFGFCLLY